MFVLTGWLVGIIISCVPCLKRFLNFGRMRTLILIVVTLHLVIGNPKPVKQVSSSLVKYSVGMSLVCNFSESSLFLQLNILWKGTLHSGIIESDSLLLDVWNPIFLILSYIFYILSVLNVLLFISIFLNICSCLVATIQIWRHHCFQ